MLDLWPIRLILQCWCNHNMINHFMARRPFRIIQFEGSLVTFKISFWISRRLPKLEKNSKCSNLYIRLLRHNKPFIVSVNTFSCQYTLYLRILKCCKLLVEFTTFYIFYLRFSRYFRLDITLWNAMWKFWFSELKFRSEIFTRPDTKNFLWLSM